MVSSRWYTQTPKRILMFFFHFQTLATSTDADINAVLTQFSGDICDLDLSLTSARQVVTSFRDFVTLTWFLHARDEMNLVLRKREATLMEEVGANRERPWRKWVPTGGDIDGGGGCQQGRPLWRRWVPTGGVCCFLTFAVLRFPPLSAGVLSGDSGFL